MFGRLWSMFGLGSSAKLHVTADFRARGPIKLSSDKASEVINASLADPYPEEISFD